MKKIAILTSTRAEYGLLASVIKKFRQRNDIETEVVVTGSHLSPEFGMTIQEIVNDGVKVNKKIEILLSSDTPVAVSKAMGLAMISFSEYFDESKPDALLVLGDRYETLAVCLAAMNARIPIVHLHGGEATEGLIDDAVRHSITKLSCLHFTSTETFRRRVIQMGEAPDRVFNSGAPGVENAVNISKMSLEELEHNLGCSLAPDYAVLTFHPVTLENNTAGDQADKLLAAIDAFPDINFLCTRANADTNGRIINEKLEKYASTHTNLYLYDSLGMKRYLSAVSHARFVIGNSSSGLIEVPSFKIPTINIGDRQKGRIMAPSVINCLPETKDIIDSIRKALSADFVNSLKDMINPYGNGSASDMIVNVTSEFLLSDKLKVSKSFYDLSF